MKGFSSSGWCAALHFAPKLNTRCKSLPCTKKTQLLLLYQPVIKATGVASINFVGVPNIYKITLPAISNTPLTLDFALDEKNYSHSWVLVFDAFGR